MSPLRHFCNLSTTGEILQASDDLSRVINSYKEIVEGQTVNGDTPGSSMSERKFHFQAVEWKENDTELELPFCLMERNTVILL